MRRIILAAMLAALPSLASAATVNHPNIVTYNLEGSALLNCHIGGPGYYFGECDPEWGPQNLPWIGLWDGKIVIDERKLDAPLAGRTTRVSFPVLPYDEWQDWVVPPGEHEAFWFESLPVKTSIAGSIFELTVNEHYRPLSWWIQILDGPPDSYLSSDGPAWMEVGGMIISGTSGHLSLHSIVPIPLPPAAALLLAGAGALVLVRRRRGQAAGGSGTGVGGGARA